MHSNHQLTTWEAFTLDLELRFIPWTFTNHQATLFKLKQSGPVMDYQVQFEMLCNRVEGFLKQSLIASFQACERTSNLSLLCSKPHRYPKSFAWSYSLKKNLLIPNHFPHVTQSKLLTRWKVYQFCTSSKVKMEAQVSSAHGLCLYLNWCIPNLQARDKELQ